MNNYNSKTTTTLNKSNPRVSIYMIMKIERAEDAEPDALMRGLVDACVGTVQPVAAVPVQKTREPQQPLPKSNESRYGDKSRKMVTPKQVELVKTIAKEKHIPIEQICDKYNVLDISQLNQAQMQEIFDRNRRKPVLGDKVTEDMF